MMTTTSLESLVNHREQCRAHLARSIKNLGPNGKSGRKPKDMPVINIYDALRRHTTITDAAESLGVSKAYIYKHVESPKDYLDGPEN